MSSPPFGAPVRLTGRHTPPGSSPLLQRLSTALARGRVVAVPPRQVVYQQIEIPEPGPEYVVVQVPHTWISNGTEGSFLRRERIAGDTRWREGDALPFPLVPGYQKVGRLHCVGAAQTKPAVP